MRNGMMGDERRAGSNQGGWGRWPGLVFESLLKRIVEDNFMRRFLLLGLVVVLGLIGCASEEKAPPPAPTVSIQPVWFIYTKPSPMEAVEIIEDTLQTATSYGIPPEMAFAVLYAENPTLDRTMAEHHTVRHTGVTVDNDISGLWRVSKSAKELAMVRYKIEHGGKEYPDSSDTAYALAILNSALRAKTLYEALLAYSQSIRLTSEPDADFAKRALEAYNYFRTVKAVIAKDSRTEVTYSVQWSKK
jgi:hypothetical protein